MIDYIEGIPQDPRDILGLRVPWNIDMLTAFGQMGDALHFQDEKSALMGPRLDDTASRVALFREMYRGRTTPILMGDKRGSLVGVDRRFRRHTPAEELTGVWGVRFRWSFE